MEEHMENLIDVTKQNERIKTNPSLKSSVETTIKKYLESMKNQNINNLYDMVISEIEEPLMQVIMQYTNQNQSRAAVILGLSRGTLRKKLASYGMIVTGSQDMIK